MPPLLTKSKAGKVLYRADLVSFAFIKRGEIGKDIVYRLQGYGRYTSHSPCALCYALQGLRALRQLNLEWRKRPCRFSRRKALRIGGYSPPYPHLSLAEAPGFATAKSGVAQAPLQIQQTQSPPHWGLLAPIPPPIVGRLATTNPDHHPNVPPLQALSPS